MKLRARGAAAHGRLADEWPFTGSSGAGSRFREPQGSRPRSARGDHAVAAAETLFGAAPEPAQPQPAWLVQLAAEFEQALLAELDLRLQPIAGMADALEHAIP